jgi:hypothetical protein
VEKGECRDVAAHCSANRPVDRIGGVLVFGQARAIRSGNGGQIEPERARSCIAIGARSRSVFGERASRPTRVYNRQRGHSTRGMASPVAYEQLRLSPLGG